jgi:hypothetical protein
MSRSERARHDSADSNVPDLGEQRALRALRRWLQEDEDGRAVLEELARDRSSGQRVLRERLERDAPTEVATYLSGSSNVGKLVNVASEVASLHIHQSETGQHSPVRLSLKPLSSKISVGDSQPCRVRVRIENDDPTPHEVELKVTGWFSDLSQIEEQQPILLRSGTWTDAWIHVAIAPTRAISLPAGTHELEAQVVNCRDGTILARDAVPLEVLPFHWITAVVEPADIPCKQWRRAWVSCQFVLQNRGNQAVEATIGQVGGQSGVEIDVQQDNADLSPGVTKQVPVRVRPLRHAYLGARTYRFRLSANLRPQDRNDAAAALHHAPLVSRKQLAWGLAVLTVLLWATVLAPRLSSPAPAPTSRPTQAVSPAPAASSATAPSVSQSAVPPSSVQGPAAVVKAFYDAVNAHDYRRAWELGGKNLSDSYQEFADGYAHTDHTTVKVRQVSGGTVTVDLIADEYNGRQQSTFTGTYTVRDGEIVDGVMEPTN